MEKYLITWDSGCGETAEVVEANTQEEANDLAYEAWKDEAESNAEYQAQVLTQDLAEEYGFDF